MATTRLYLDRRGKAKDGKGNIIITLFHNGSTSSIPTGIRIYPDNWHDGRVVKCSEAVVLNARLQEQKGKIDKDIAVISFEDGFEKMTATQIKVRIARKKVSPNRGHLVSDMFAEYLSRDIKEGTKEIYRATLAKALAFGGKALKMEEINLKWLHRFEMFLAKTQGVNGRAIYLRSLRAVCNYALHTNVISQYPFQNFQVKQEPTRKRSVSIELFRQFLDYPTTARNQIYRDYFLLMFYLIGINSKDLLLARKDNLVKGRFEYIREKTHKKYSIKIEPEAEELLKRYQGKHFLLEAMDHCRHYKSFAHEINDGLKEIGPVIEEEVLDADDLFAPVRIEKQIHPIIPGISTYYARHCWATFAYEIGIPLDTISQALGHSSGNRTTLIYVKFDQEKIDNANRRVIDFLLRSSD